MIPRCFKRRYVEQIVERVVGKGDMLETSAHTIVISKMGIVEHRQPMVLVVVGQKGEERAFVPRFSAEHRRPPLHYLLKASRAQDDVGQLRGRIVSLIPRGYQLL